jgi:hypothetical protein
MRLERMDLTPELAAKAESAEFPGRAIAALATDPNVMSKSGGLFITPQLARVYGLTDIDGKQQSAFSGPNTGPELGRKLDAIALTCRMACVWSCRQ